MHAGRYRHPEQQTHAVVSFIFANRCGGTDSIGRPNCKYRCKTNVRGAADAFLVLRCPVLSGQIHTAAPGNLDDGRWTCAPLRLSAEPQAAGRRVHPETPADIVGQYETRAGVLSF